MLKTIQFSVLIAGIMTSFALGFPGDDNRLSDIQPGEVVWLDEDEDDGLLVEPEDANREGVVATDDDDDLGQIPENEMMQRILDAFGPEFDPIRGQSNNS